MAQAVRVQKYKALNWNSSAAKKYKEINVFIFLKFVKNLATILALLFKCVNCVFFLIVWI
jgi:hypothetical protein